ncbi:Shikimate and dehydroshikimate transport protein [Paenibacillus mucilaginosus 3016]|uniref:Shikimate and dehydroshikimate transport protein n=1 Tax=Paenibacillus mucilaginosus 3016 TaxID=1116391 RepID=H6NE94_9BACL|nr:Shikimate and dehydroshikimate transport protein [Paenibacillus mucilaginosus 3016]
MGVTIGMLVGTLSIYQLGAAIAGGTAPLNATALLNAYNKFVGAGSHLYHRHRRDLACCGRCGA